jgi:hypothetical protein
MFLQKNLATLIGARVFSRTEKRRRLKKNPIVEKISKKSQRPLHVQGDAGHPG